VEYNVTCQHTETDLPCTEPAFLSSKLPKNKFVSYFPLVCNLKLVFPPRFFLIVFLLDVAEFSSK
jgi:hypothetical protein